MREFGCPAALQSYNYWTYFHGPAYCGRIGEYDSLTGYQFCEGWNGHYKEDFRTEILFCNTCKKFGIAKTVEVHADHSIHKHQSGHPIFKKKITVLLPGETKYELAEILLVPIGDNWGTETIPGTFYLRFGYHPYWPKKAPANWIEREEVYNHKPLGIWGDVDFWLSIDQPICIVCAKRDFWKTVKAAFPGVRHIKKYFKILQEPSHIENIKGKFFHGAFLHQGERFARGEQIFQCIACGKFSIAKTSKELIREDYYCHSGFCKEHKKTIEKAYRCVLDNYLDLRLHRFIKKRDIPLVFREGKEHQLSIDRVCVVYLKAEVENAKR